MGGEWRETTLDQLGPIITGKTPPSGITGCFGGDIPFVTPTDFDGRRIIDWTARQLTEHGAAAVRSSRVPRWAVMVSCIGSDMGKTAIAGRECVTNQQINSIAVNSANEPHFIYYNLSHRKAEIRQAASGSAQPILNKSAFGQLRILLPPLPEQRAIARILAAFDDKIELNRRMNETLEAMARVLFKSWFIDFEPVRAKAEGRDPGLPKPIADLFPAHVVDSELGEIPGGWKSGVVDDLTAVLGGSTPRTNQPSFWEGGTHCWATPKDLSALFSPVLLETERRITDSGLAQIGSGLLPEGTVLLSSRAPIGYLAIAEVPVAINQGFIAMKPRKGVPSFFLLLWARSAHQEIVSHANGSTFLEISKATFRRLPIALPPPALLSAFGRLTNATYKRIVSNQHQMFAMVPVVWTASGEE
jgi:type I restriction enzyme S subunit